MKCAEENNVVIPPNRTCTIRSTATDLQPHPDSTAMLQPTQKTVLPDSAELMPVVMSYKTKGVNCTEVTISNHSSRLLVISPRATLGELQPVTVEEAPPVMEDGEENNELPVDLNLEQDEDSATSKEESKQFRDYLTKWGPIFSTGPKDVGSHPTVKHHINLRDHSPIKGYSPRIPPHLYEDLKDHLQDLLGAGLIQPSQSPWSSNIVIAKKKNRSIRFCIDYRKLNQKTVPDAYAMPRLDDVLDCLHGAKYFSVLDMKSGYHQIGMSREHRPCTAFTAGSLGFYKWTRMSFGLMNAPATYQRMMENMLGELNHHVCVIYLDDIVVFSKSFDQHLIDLAQVFARIQACNLKLAPSKCHFLRKKVRFLGHIISEDGVEADPEKVERVVNWPQPTGADDLMTFLGFAGYYRRFCQGFAMLAKPLYDLIGGDKKKGKKTKQDQPKPKPEWKWGAAQQEAFEAIKKALTSPPVLSFADFASPFTVHTDASGLGLGAVLYQTRDGQEKHIFFASRGLSK